MKPGKMPFIYDEKVGVWPTSTTGKTIFNIETELQDEGNGRCRKVRRDLERSARTQRIILCQMSYWSSHMRFWTSRSLELVTA